MSDSGYATGMAGKSSAFLDRLISKGCEFDFFQAVWLLEKYFAQGAPIGERGPVSQEQFRFRPHTAMGFPSCDIMSIRQYPGGEGGLPYFCVDVTFMGLYGVSTPLPLHYAVDVLRSVERGVGRGSGSAQPSGQEEDRGRMRQEEQADEAGRSPLRDFLDIFHHRLISLFYRSWLKYRFDRTYGHRGHDVITAYLLWLIGVPPDCGQELLGVAPTRMLRYAGLLTQRPKSAACMRGMLADYWSPLPVGVEQCAGRWVSISTTDLNRLGQANCTVGVDLTVGEEVYDISGSFSVSIGPMDWEAYLSFLPDGECFARTRSLVKLYNTDPLGLTIELIVKEDRVPEMKLSSDGEAGRLGYTSWVRTFGLGETSVRFTSTSGTDVAGGERPDRSSDEADREPAEPLESAVI